MALFYLAGGVACLREYFIKHDSQTILYAGWFCVFPGLLGLPTFVLCQRQIRAGKPPKSLFTLPLRKTILGCVMFGYLMLFAIVHVKLSGIISRSGLGQLMLFSPLLWLLTAPLVWNGIVRYFINHPPKN